MLWLDCKQFLQIKGYSTCINADNWNPQKLQNIYLYDINQIVKIFKV